MRCEKDTHLFHAEVGGTLGEWGGEVIGDSRPEGVAVERDLCTVCTFLPLVAPAQPIDIRTAQGAVIQPGVIHIYPADPALDRRSVKVELGVSKQCALGITHYMIS